MNTQRHSHDVEITAPDKHLHRVCSYAAAKQLDDVVSGLTHMSEKQLKAVSHLLGEEVVAAVQIAARLPRSNQVCCPTMSQLQTTQGTVRTFSCVLVSLHAA